MPVPEFKFRHLGINSTDPATATDTVSLLCELFGLEARKLIQSTMVGSDIEVMDHAEKGQHGHIAFTVSSIPDALNWLASMGWQAEHQNTVHKEDGSLKIIYLSKEIAGFAVHLFEE